MFASKDTLLTRPSGYTIARSVRLRSSATAYFSRTPSSTGNRRTYTHSFWAKRGILGALRWVYSARESTTSGNYFYEGLFYSDDTFSVQLRDGSSNEVGNIRTTQVFRDPSAWYHFVVVIDTTQATSSNRMKLYVNGSQVTALGTATYPSQNFDTGANTSGYPFYIGNYVTTSPSSLYNYDGYLTEINFIDGQALTPSSFGETDSITGVWKPKAYSGTYGTNGFELNFSDNSNNTAATIGKDYSGNGNNWTPNNISVTAGVTYDSMVDSPTVGATSSNYCVMNPLNTTGGTISNGNLSYSFGNFLASVTMAAPTSGKWYWETTVTSLSGAAGFVLGIYDPNNSNQAVGANLNVVGVAYYSVDGTKYVSGVNTAYGATFGTNDVIGVALNADSGTVAFYKNNTSQGSITLPSSVGGWIFQAQGQGGSNSAVVELNFGQRPFTYTPPTGFVALNTYNLPASTITNGAAYMAATTYTGTGASLTVANTVGSTSFQPDWVWVKGRSGATDHALYDSVRGVQKQIESNTTTAETTETTGLTAFGSTGFTVGALAQMNTSSATYVAWQWKAGTTSASNTSGILTSQVSANTTAGFSVCTYTAPASSQANSFGHGLGVAPSMVIAKNRSSGTGGLGWAVYHSSLGANQVLSLNTTAASATVSGYWGSGMTSTVVGLPTCASSTGFDNCTGNMVAYCFSAVAGYSAFGSFVGNGTQGAGPFVFLGFRPRYVLIKNINGAYDWHCFDTSRGQYNYSGSNILKPNASDAELTARNDVQIDFLSNGFRLIGNDIGINQNGSTHIYITFAENPFRNALAF